MLKCLTFQVIILIYFISFVCIEAYNKPKTHQYSNHIQNPQKKSLKWRTFSRTFLQNVKWSKWSKCENCQKTRTGQYIFDHHQNLSILEATPCTLKFCKHKTKQRKEVHVYSLMKAAIPGRWNEWTKFPACNQSCLSSRKKYCKGSTCPSKLVTETSDCFQIGTACEAFVLNNVFKAAEYQKHRAHDHKCGILSPRINFKILGGEMSRYTWPWHIALVNINKDIYCSGTLIAPFWILTAAHCLPQLHYVRINDHSQYSFDNNERDLEVENYFSHPHFRYEPNHDIALIKLRSPSRNTVACLPKNPPKPKQICSVMGWGKLKNTDIWGPNILRQAKIPIVYDRVCKKAYPGLSSNMFCAGWKSGKSDTCAGDSGGGLMCPVKLRNRKMVFTLQGIISSGDGCGLEEKYGIYTKVYNYIKWIKEIIRQNT